MRVALLTSATGKQPAQWQKFLDTAQQYFFPNLDRQFFIFADDASPATLPAGVTWCSHSGGNENGQRIRCKLPILPTEVLHQFDYAFYVSTDLEFRQVVTSELLPDSPSKLLVVQHPEYVNTPANRLPYERDHRSTALVDSGLGQYYVTDKIVGGSAFAYGAMHQSIEKAMVEDFRNGVVAVRSVESYLNRYITDHPHSIRHAGYCYPRGWDLGVPKILECNLENNDQNRQALLDCGGLDFEPPEASVRRLGQIIVEINGDLGCQLFSYAQGFSLSQRLGCRLLLDTRNYHQQLQPIYRLGSLNIHAELAGNSMLPTRVNRSLRQFLPGRLASLYESRAANGLTIIDEQNYYRNRHLFHFPGKFYLRGPWHHEAPSRKHSQRLRDEFRSCVPKSSLCQSLLSQVRSTCSVAIDLSCNKDITLPASRSRREQLVCDYIRGAIEIVRSKNRQSLDLFVLTDDSLGASKFFENEDHVHIVARRDCADELDQLQWMSACRHQVIAGSKLGWWAAWLNPNVDKCVVVPSADTADSIWGDHLPAVEGWNPLKLDSSDRAMSKAA